jgi:hypothetical protein
MTLSDVMPGLVPGIHVFRSPKTENFKSWMAGTSPAMTRICGIARSVSDEAIHTAQPLGLLRCARNDEYAKSFSRRIACARALLTTTTMILCNFPKEGSGAPRGALFN